MTQISKITSDMHIEPQKILVYGRLQKLKEGTGLATYQTNQMGAPDLVSAILNQGEWSEYKSESNGFMVQAVRLGDTTCLVATTDDEIRFALIG